MTLFYLKHHIITFFLLVELLMGEVEKCLNMRPNYETLVARAKLAEVCNGFFLLELSIFTSIFE